MFENLKHGNENGPVKILSLMSFLSIMEVKLRIKKINLQFFLRHSNKSMPLFAQS